MDKRKLFVAIGYFTIKVSDIVAIEHYDGRVVNSVALGTGCKVMLSGGHSIELDEKEQTELSEILEEYVDLGFD